GGAGAGGEGASSAATATHGGRAGSSTVRWKRSSPAGCSASCRTATRRSRVQSERSSTSSVEGSGRATTAYAEPASTPWTIAKLGVGALGLAWSLTTTAAYLP